MIPFLMSFGKVNPWRVLHLTLATVLVMMILYVWAQRLEMEKMEIAYQHPLIAIQTKTVKVQGPVRIVTKIVEREGKKETIIQEERGMAWEGSGSSSLTTPVLPPASPEKRWFVGAGIIGLTDHEGIVFGGVTLFGRLDLGLGVTTEIRPMALVTFRF